MEKSGAQMVQHLQLALSLPSYTRTGMIDKSHTCNMTLVPK